MIVPRFKEEVLPKLDTRAGRQIFDREKGHREPVRYVVVSPKTDNPIDIKLRELSFSNEEGRVDLKSVFYNLNAVIKYGEGNAVEYIKGKIKDLYFTTRDVYIRTRKGDIYIVPFDKVISTSEREV